MAEDGKLLSYEQMMTELLDSALKIGISEHDFWEMTMGEIYRAGQAYSWRQEQQLKLQATMDYNLANLIGISIGRCLDSGVKMPTIFEAYSGIFSQEDEDEARNRLNIERFKNFAQNFKLNKKDGD